MAPPAEALLADEVFVPPVPLAPVADALEAPMVLLLAVLLAALLSVLVLVIAVPVLPSTLFDAAVASVVVNVVDESASSLQPISRPPASRPTSQKFDRAE